MGTKLSELVEEFERGAAPEERAALETFRTQYTRAEQILRLRKQRAVTQVELAELAGLDQAEISRLERGAGNPTEQTLERVAAALGARWELVGVEHDGSRPTADLP